MSEKQLATSIIVLCLISFSIYIYLGSVYDPLMMHRDIIFSNTEEVNYGEVINKDESFLKRYLVVEKDGDRQVISVNKEDYLKFLIGDDYIKQESYTLKRIVVEKGTIKGKDYAIVDTEKGLILYRLYSNKLNDIKLGGYIKQEYIKEPIFSGDRLYNKFIAKIELDLESNSAERSIK